MLIELSPCGFTRDFRLGLRPETGLQHIERWSVGHASEMAPAGVDQRILRAQAREAQANRLVSAACSYQ